jgi:type IV secretory pathway VirB2 component (pilin)
MTTHKLSIVRILFCAFGLWAVATGTAHADVAGILCDIYNTELVENFGPGIATMAVIAVGIAAALGRASAGMAIMAAVGIFVLFEAPTIAGAFGVTGC